MPLGEVKSPPKTMRFAPTFKAIEVKAVIKALGIPSLSSSFATVAQQRVQVPHVEVKMAADTPAFFSSLAILLPMSLLFSTLVPTPQVVKK